MDKKPEKKQVEPGPKQKTWLESAKQIEATIGGQKLFLEPRVFSTGSVGYAFSGKLQLPYGDTGSDRVQVSANFTVVGSKEW